MDLDIIWTKAWKFWYFVKSKVESQKLSTVKNRPKIRCFFWFRLSRKSYQNYQNFQHLSKILVYFWHLTVYVKNNCPKFDQIDQKWLKKWSKITKIIPEFSTSYQKWLIFDLSVSVKNIQFFFVFLFSRKLA